MSSITAEDIDDFLDVLSQKPCRGPKSYGKRPEDIPTLSSSTVKKCFTVLTSGFETAKKWHYINEIPKVTAPTEKTVKRRAWDARRVYEVLDSIKEDELLHLSVHLAFVCSLRAGETVGIDLHNYGYALLKHAYSDMNPECVLEVVARLGIAYGNRIEEQWKSARRRKNSSDPKSLAIYTHCFNVGRYVPTTSRAMPKQVSRFCSGGMVRPK